MSLSDPCCSTMADDIVKLNVGGKHFEVLKATLLSFPDTYFTGMLSGSFQSSHSHFIDVDPQCFAHVLNYLRYRCVPNDTCPHLAGIRATAEFLGLDAFVSELPGPSSTANKHAPNENKVTVYTYFDDGVMDTVIFTNPVLPNMFSYDAVGGLPSLNQSECLQDVLQKLTNADFDVQVKPCKNFAATLETIGECNVRKYTCAPTADDGDTAPTAKKRKTR